MAWRIAKRRPRSHAEHQALTVLAPGFDRLRSVALASEYPLLALVQHTLYAAALPSWPLELPLASSSEPLLAVRYFVSRRAPASYS